ncbi:MAG TPA: hypothetical protein VFT29_02530 [Gemmatimonadaceae bacterium]|nr:hypothetical protein [Gemmatimonadaceae bacterium]
MPDPGVGDVDRKDERAGASVQVTHPQRETEYTRWRSQQMRYQQIVNKSLWNTRPLSTSAGVFFTVVAVNESRKIAFFCAELRSS